MLWAQGQPTQQIPTLPPGTPLYVQLIVYGTFVSVALIGAVGTYLGTRKPKDKPPPDDDKPADPKPGPVAQQAEASQALMERLVAGLEKRLDDALATQQTIQAKYDREVDELRAQLTKEQEEKWRLSADLQNLRGQLEEARTEVIRLRAELQAVRPPRGPW